MNMIVCINYDVSTKKQRHTSHLCVCVCFFPDIPRYCFHLLAFYGLFEQPGRWPANRRASSSVWACRSSCFSNDFTCNETTRSFKCSCHGLQFGDVINPNNDHPTMTFGIHHPIWTILVLIDNDNDHSAGMHMKYGTSNKRVDWEKTGLSTWCVKTLHRKTPCLV